MAVSEVGVVFHIWSPSDGKVLCGKATPARIVQPSWAKFVNPSALCGDCVAKRAWLESSRRAVVTTIR